MFALGYRARKPFDACPLITEALAELKFINNMNFFYNLGCYVAATWYRDVKSRNCTVASGENCHRLGFNMIWDLNCVDQQ